MCSQHKIYRSEGVGLSLYNIRKRNAIFVSLSNFGQFHEKLSITTWLEFESKNPFAHMWHMKMWLTAAYHTLFCVFTVILPSVTYSKLSPQNASKRGKTCRLYSANYRLKYFFRSNCKQLWVFKIVRFEFKVIVHYWLCPKRRRKTKQKSTHIDQ